MTELFNTLSLVLLVLVIIIHAMALIRREKLVRVLACVNIGLHILLYVSLFLAGGSLKSALAITLLSYTLYILFNYIKVRREGDK